jgi:hypothetical protein
MEIKVNNQIIEIQEATDLIDYLFQAVRDVISANSELSFGHLIVDGKELYINDFQQLDIDQESKTIEIIFNNKTKLIAELVTSSNEYISNALPATEDLANEFYKSPSSRSWDQLNELFEALDWLNQMLMAFCEISLNHQEVAKEVGSQLFLQLEELHKAMTNQDYVLIGDLLKYEVTELLISVRAVANQIDEEVVVHDKN